MINGRQARLLGTVCWILLVIACGEDSNSGSGITGADVANDLAAENDVSPNDVTLIEDVSDTSPDTALDSIAADDADTDHADVDADLTEDVAPLPEKGETVWLILDSDEPQGAHNFGAAPEMVYEFARFHTLWPARIWSFRAMFQTAQDSKITVYLWNDFGGDFIDFQVDPPLAATEISVTAAQSGRWIDIPLAYPIDLVPGRMFYAGVIVNGAGSPHLMVDATPSDPPYPDTAPPSLVWQSAEPLSPEGFPAISLAAGDYMLRVEAEQLEVVTDFHFEALTDEISGIPGFGRLAFADIDDDGDDDVMLDGPRLLVNDGFGVYTDMTSQALADITGHNGGVWGDYDNDGDPDYFATGLMDRLLRNDDGLFVDVTPESGIDDAQEFMCDGTGGVQNVPTEAAAWLDIDNDGDLDLYQANFICWVDGYGSQDKLWLNQGDGTFVDASASLGIVSPQYLKAHLPDKYFLAGRGLAPADYDSDGDMDLLVANYRLHRNLMWENEDGQRMVSVGESSTLEGVGTLASLQMYFGHTIGAVWGDIDFDGDLDLFQANLSHPRFFSFSQVATMYENPGGPSPVFQDVTDLIGIRYQETPSNPTLWDFDNDSDLDLFYTCVYSGRQSQFYRNDGHPMWSEITYQSGLGVYGGWGAAAADIDQDGDLDLVAGPQKFSNHNLADNGAIFIRPRGKGAGFTNKSGFGVRVIAEVSGNTVVRELSGASGTGIQDSPYVHIGIGKLTSAKVQVHFVTTGTIVDLGMVEAGSRLIVDEDGTTIEF
ncbi:MAG: VCBS repeat-containing protein [Myxococcales bacterium]|nr:VCBS repeat-containing protein [Myxococcales bacterium]